MSLSFRFHAEHVRVFDALDVDIACRVDVPIQRNIVLLILEFQRVLVAVADMQANTDSPVFDDGAVE